jgi:hypothetical protein
VRGVSVAPDDVTASVRVALALRAIAREGRYDALALRDWPEFQEVLGLHPGMACSWVDEVDGVPVAAEGDVLGALGMLVGRALASPAPHEVPAMLLDVNEIDLESDALLMWHCGGSPLGIADEWGARWVDHSTLGRKAPGAGPRGAVADLRFRRGDVTLLRLRNDGSELFALDASVIPHASSGFSGSRGWVGSFRADSGPCSALDVLHTLFVHGVEHHIVLAPGRHAAAARELAGWRRMRLTPLTPYRDELVIPEEGDPV